MGIPVLTALIIQTRGSDVHCEAGKDPKTKLWAGYISLYRDGEFDHFLISTAPSYRFKWRAIREMKKIVAQVKKADLSPEKVLKSQPTAKEI